MRRRLSSLSLAALLALAVLLPAAPAVAADVAPADVVVLAAAGHTSDAGLDPMSPDDEENEFRPADYEANWTWRAGKALLGLILFGAIYLGLMYYLRVVRPSRSAKS